MYTWSYCIRERVGIVEISFSAFAIVGAYVVDAVFGAVAEVEEVIAAFVEIFAF